MIPKIIFFTLMLIVIIGCQQEIEESVQVMQKSSINEYNWNSRLLLINVDNNENELYKSLLKFQIEKYCEFEDRKLIGIKFKDGSNDAYFTPDFISNQYGMWLVGYDGTVKGYSDDQKLLTDLFVIIDQMPIRKTEIEKSKSSCE